MTVPPASKVDPSKTVLCAAHLGTKGAYQRASRCSYQVGFSKVVDVDARIRTKGPLSTDIDPHATPRIDRRSRGTAMMPIMSLGPNDPREIGGYRLARRIAAGGQGVVYLGHDAAGHAVAVKVLQANWISDPTARRRMAVEIDAARRVAAFCTARVIGADPEANPPFIVSEFVDGPSLAQHVRDRGPLVGSALDRLAIGTATALVAIHQAHVVHRDFKPANVIIGPDGPRVIDFGIARDMTNEPTMTGKLYGTPGYMAPEQLAGQPVTSATDLFAWASTMVFAATGHNAFNAPTVDALLMKIAHGEPDLTAVPSPLLSIVTMCLAKDPAARPSAVSALMRLLGEPTPPRDLPTITATALTMAAQRIGLNAPTYAAPTQTAVTQPAVTQPGLSQPAVVGYPATAPYPTTGAPTTPYPSTGGPVTGGTIGNHPHYAYPAQPPASSRQWPIAVGALILAGTVLVAVITGFGTYTLLDNGQQKIDPTPASTGNSTVRANAGAGQQPTKPPAQGDGLTVPAEFDGQWSGSMIQTVQGVGVIGTPTLTITLESGSSTGKATFPSLQCAGDLTVVSPAPTADGIHLHLTMTQDAKKQCLKNAEIALSPDRDGGLALTFVDSVHSTNTAIGLLKPS